MNALYVNGKPGVGIWNWNLTRRDFPWNAFVDLCVDHGLNLTAFCCETNREGTIYPEQYSEAWAQLVAERIENWHERTGGLVLVYAFNVYYKPWSAGIKGWRQTLQLGPGGRLSYQHLDHLDILYTILPDKGWVLADCLEPKDDQREWCEAVARYWHEDNTGSIPIVHNGNWGPHPRGFDFYEAGGNNFDPRSPVDFFNGDHHQRGSSWGDWTGEYSPANQEHMIASRVASELSMLMVTTIHLAGKDWILEDWEHNQARWSSERTLRTFARRVTNLPNPEPVEPPKSLPWPEHYMWTLINRKEQLITQKNFVHDTKVQEAMMALGLRDRMPR